MASPTAKLLIIALIPVAVAGLLAATYLTRDRGEPGGAVEIEGPMPSPDGESLSGEAFDPTALRGRVVVVNFWASWCGPCRREQPALQALSEEYAERGVRFVGINFRDDLAAAREYVREFGVTYPSVVDPDGKLAHEFGIPYLPATVLVDRSGEMRYRLLGAQTEGSLRRYLEEVLASA